MYAVIETGGKQYKVTPGQTIDVEKLKVPAGEPVTLNKVLLIADGEKVTVGTPVVSGAEVTAISQGDYKGDKLIVFKYKSKARYRRKTGHRQLFTRLTIDKIVEPGAASVAGEPTKKVRRRKKEVKESGA